MKGLGVAFVLIFTLCRALAQVSNPVPTSSSPTNVQSNQSTANATQQTQANSSPTPAISGGASQESDSARWTANAIAFLNLLIVCYVFAYSQSSRKRERQEDSNRAVALFWVQDLILKPNLENLHQFFSKYEREIESLKAEPPTGSRTSLQKQARTQISAFKLDFHNIRRKVVEPLLLVSQGFSPVRTVFSSIEDFVTDHYTRIPGIVTQENGLPRDPGEEFRDLQQNFFAELHHSQMALVESAGK